jgi:beta-lactamase regulating signal transducer with metallopeptidase domain
MMQFDRSIASLGLGITYFLQVVLAYLTTLSICAFLDNARLRVRIWGGFLLWAIAAWVVLWIPARNTRTVLAALHPLRLPPITGLHIATPVAEPWVSYFAKVAPLFALLYFSFVLISALYLFVESRRLKSVLRRTRPASPQLQICFERLCHELHVARCELRLATDLRSPATCYWWRSHVLLPMELVPDLDSDELEDVLRHELFHVKQHDYLWDRLAALGCRVVFFHPLVWLAYRHLRWDRELACDYAVVRESSEARLRYAECLTKLASWFMARRMSSPGITFFSSESLLKVRVRAVLSEPSVCSPSREAARAGLVSGFATLVVLLLPGLGLSLYSPIRLTSFLVSPENARSSSSRNKGAKTKHTHLSTPKTLTIDALQITSRPGGEEQINALLETPPVALPALSSSARDNDSPIESKRVKENVGLQSRRDVWDEKPMPLANPPKWRSLAIGAITGAIGMATGQIDPDDIDGPRKRGR